jgi:hypothetical protein
MKRIDPIRHLDCQGCQLMREGRQHSLTSIAKPGNPPPYHVIEKFPLEQFEAFAELLEFRLRSEKSWQS